MHSGTDSILALNISILCGGFSIDRIDMHLLCVTFTKSITFYIAHCELGEGEGGTQSIHHENATTAGLKIRDGMEGEMHPGIPVIISKGSREDQLQSSGTASPPKSPQKWTIPPIQRWRSWGTFQLLIFTFYCPFLAPYLHPSEDARKGREERTR